MRMRHAICGQLLAALGLLMAGCAHVCDYVDSSITCIHCEKQALHTWHYFRDSYAGVRYPHHFGAGFRAGYVDVCRGGSGCPPTLPPRCYWTFHYRNEVGRAKIVEWFNGFAAGAATAMGEGYQQFAQLPTAQEVAGRCGCEERIEYDLPDLHRPAVIDEADPVPSADPWPEDSDDIHKVHTEPPPAIETLPEPSIESAPPAASSHRQATPADSLPPVNTNPRPAPKRVVSPAKTAADADASNEVEAQPELSAGFGHSIKTPADNLDTQTPAQADEPSAPALVWPAIDQPRHESTSTRQIPLPPLPSGHDRSTLQPYSPPPQPPGAGSPYLIPGNVWPSPAPPATEPEANEIPLEDRFLPRNGQDSETTGVRVQPATRSRLEEFGRIQRTSHRSGAR